MLDTRDCKIIKILNDFMVTDKKLANSDFGIVYLGLDKTKK